MPAATLIFAGLAALEPPRRPERPFIQTTWSLTASPIALATAPQGPLVGPGQARQPVPIPVPPATEQRGREVTVLPAPEAAFPDEPKDFDDLQDPAADGSATAEAPADAASAGMPADGSTIDAAAPDPLEDELAQSIQPASDPLEPINRVSFAISQVIDKALLRPVALTYRKVAPKPLRDGLRNVLSNWGAPITFVNDLLQLKPKRAVKTLGRFLLNTVLGLGGLFDIAKEKKFNLPYHGNRFSNTLAMYGVKLGPYIYLPVLGPSTLLDQADRAQGYIPGIDNPVFRNGRGSVFQYLLGLEDRANNDQELKTLLEDAVDPYATFRETWLQNRKAEIAQLKAPDGQEPGTYQANPLDDPLTDPAADPAAGPEPEPASPPAEEAAKPVP